MSTVRIFACGGTGTNIANKLSKYQGQTNPGLAEISVCFIDTSRSNLSPSIGDDQVFIYTDRKGDMLDGNGKVRNANIDVLSDQTIINEILHRFKPADYNIVIHSAAGGTGSVAGPLLAREIISKGGSCVVLMVGAIGSAKELQNTYKTLKTYEKISQDIGFPINVLYRENTPDRPRSDVDSDIQKYAFLMSAFFSGQNHGLDSADLRNFLNYNNVTSYPPRLTALDIFAGNARLPENSLAISAVTLTETSEDVNHNFLIDYQTTGILSAENLSVIGDQLPLHMLTFSGFFTAVIARLEKIIKQHEEKASRVQSRSIIDQNDKAGTGGLIF